jgi:Transposase domain (DUF772)
MYRPCGDSPRLRMPLGAAASEQVNLKLAYRWICRLGLEGKVPDRSAFSKNRQGRFRDSDAFGDTPCGSLRNLALTHLNGTNGGSSGFASHEKPKIVARNGETVCRSDVLTRPPPLAKNGARPAPRNRNLNHAHKIWL